MTHPKKKQKEPFLMLFPWGRVAWCLFAFLFVIMFVFRLSETGGITVSRACLTAIIVSLISGLAGFYCIAKTWGRDVYTVLVGIIIGAVIRLLISGISIAIIILFMAIHRTWYVVFLGIYYFGFLVIDTWFALWVIRNTELWEQKQRIHGNLWDILS